MAELFHLQSQLLERAPLLHDEPLLSEAAAFGSCCCLLLVIHAAAAAAAGRSSVTMLVTSISFDPHVFVIFGPLVAGGTLVVPHQVWMDDVHSICCWNHGCMCENINWCASHHQAVITTANATSTRLQHTTQESARLASSP
jgi:hypothetical protein